eukprot:2984114-Rhodomonas_salina.2
MTSLAKGVEREQGGKRELREWRKKAGSKQYILILHGANGSIQLFPLGLRAVCACENQTSQLAEVQERRDATPRILSPPSRSCFLAAFAAEYINFGVICPGGGRSGEGVLGG